MCMQHPEEMTDILFSVPRKAEFFLTSRKFIYQSKMSIYVCLCLQKTCWLFCNTDFGNNNNNKPHNF